MSEIRKFIRTKIANFLDRYAETCSISLLMWSTYPDEHSFLEIWPWRNWTKETVWEQICSESEGGYCGKCEITGRLTKRNNHKGINKDDYTHFPFPLPNRNPKIEFREDNDD